MKRDINLSMPKSKSKINVLPTANRDKIVVDTGAGVVVVDRISPPTFYIGGPGGVCITEYDARGIQSQVARGDLSADSANSLDIVDESGCKFVFREDGALVNTPRGYDTLSKLALEVLKTKKTK